MTSSDFPHPPTSGLWGGLTAPRAHPKEVTAIKLLTLNTHSLLEEQYEEKLTWFLDMVLREQPDVIALQEVNQTMTAPEVAPDALPGFLPIPGCTIPVRKDNHAARVAQALHRAGIPCVWTWLPIKVGYGKYDEGAALLRLNGSITGLDAFRISRCGDYHNWKTRKVLGIRIDGRDDWFYTAHMGWWDDADEPFAAQWSTLDERLAVQKTAAPVWLMGDFNSPAEVRAEGYDCIRNSGWHDTYLLADDRDGGLTVAGTIDGWRSRTASPTGSGGMRIDHIWCSRPVPIRTSRVRFNGICDRRVSDHFGVLIETKELNL